MTIRRPEGSDAHGSGYLLPGIHGDHFKGAFQEAGRKVGHQVGSHQVHALEGEGHGCSVIACDHALQQPQNDFPAGRESLTCIVLPAQQDDGRDSLHCAMCDAGMGKGLGGIQIEQWTNYTKPALLEVHRSNFEPVETYVQRFKPCLFINMS